MSTEQERKKTVLITGCTPGGIGFAAARQFQSRGFHVLATARNAKVLEELRNDGMSAIHLDVTLESSITECRDKVEKLTDGKLDILVNNAGRGLLAPAIETPLSQARSVYETNLFGPMALTAALTPFLIPTRGLIINISSISALLPYVFGSVYASSKAALESYSRTLRAELYPFGVRVMVVMAGAVRSRMVEKAQGYEGLREESMYAPVRHLFERRLGFSQRAEAGPMETDVFAEKLVDAALREEVSVWWRRWFGRPDWWFEGGMARLVYWGSWLGEWALDLGARWKFGMREFHNAKY